MRLTFGTGAVAIFGGSGGIGAAIVRAFAGSGCDVAFTYNSAEEKASRLRQDLERDGVKVTAHRLDVRKHDEVRDQFDAMVAAHGRIRTVVYASGPMFGLMPLADVPPDAFAQVVMTDVLGFHAIIHHVVPHLRDNRGSIVACVTVANRRVLPMDGQSAVPKAAVESAIRQLAVEEGPAGLRANAVGLGWFNAGQGAYDGSSRSLTSPEGAELMAARVPAGRRAGEASEAANAALFLASEQASYISGQTLFVDGAFGL